MDNAGLGAEEVAAKEFPVAFRGFAQHEVRAFLAQVAAELAAARERERLQRERLQAAEERAASHPLSDAEVEVALGHEAGKVLQAAREAAIEIRSRAEQQVERLVRDASGEGSRLQEEAESLLVRRTEEAEQAAEEIRSEAERQAEAEVEQAKTRGREMVGEAQAVRERVLKDLARRRRVAHQQLEQLRAGRERLLEAYRVVRSTLDEATKELSAAEAEARVAAEMASLRMGAQPETTVDELEAELSAARDIGLDLLAPSPATGPAGPGPDAGGAPDDALAAGPEASAAPEPSERHEDSGDLPAEGAPAPVIPSDPPAGADGAVGAELGPAPEEPSDVEDVPEPAQSEPAAPVPSDAGAPPDGPAPPDAPAPPDLRPSELEPPEPELSEAAFEPAAPAPADAEEPPDPRPSDPRLSDPRLSEPASVGPEPSVRPRPPEPEPVSSVVVDAGPPVDEVATGAAGEVEELFARLRAERAAAVATAEDLLAGSSPAPEPVPVKSNGAASAVVDHERDAAAPVPSPRGADDVLEVRDVEIEPVERALVKALKRALADEQNEVLDTLRRLRGPAALADLLPGPSDHTARYLAVATADLCSAAAAGTGAGGGGPSIDDLAANLAAEVVDDLRARLQRALEASDGDEARLVEGISAAYREWKTSRAEPSARHHVVAAHNRGRFAAVADVALRWVVDPEEGPCPDCEDNSLAGATAKGDPFPTGQEHPPAHVGCRCTIVADAG